MTEQELVLGNYQMFGCVLIVCFIALIIYILWNLFFIVKENWRALK